MQDSRSIRLRGKPALFEELAQPDDRGVSRLVGRGELVGPYAELGNFGNGGSWCRSVRYIFAVGDLFNTSLER